MKVRAIAGPQRAHPLPATIIDTPATIAGRQGMMPKGTIVEKKVSTIWYFWRCPEKGCKTELKNTVEQFVVTAASNHQDKHQRDRETREKLERQRQSLRAVN